MWSEDRTSECFPLSFCKLQLPDLKRGVSHLTMESSIRSRVEGVLGGCWWLLVGLLLPSTLPLTWHSPGRGKGLAHTKTGREGGGEGITVIEQLVCWELGMPMSLHL